MARSFTLISAALVLGLSSSQQVLADWRDDVGYTRLLDLSAADLPAAPSRGFSQIEATQAVSPVTFLPDSQNPLFSGKTFTNRSAASGNGISEHATRVAKNFFGTATSLITGNCQIDNYFVDDWLFGDFLRTGVNAVPLNESRAVQNHSWVAASAGFPEASAQEINRRLDFAINRDGFVCCVGSDNAGASILPQLLCQSYNTISVGRDDGNHSAGLTDFDGPGRTKPDIVAPSASPEFATSWTTPMVAGAAGLLHAKLVAAPYSLTGANLPRVIKSLLLATATKTSNWANTSTRPLDPEYGAGVLNVYHAYQALRSGGVSTSTSIAHPPRGWAAETVNGNSSKTYYFTIPAGAVATPFRAALTWHRSVSKTGGGTWNASLANLNLRLYQANGFSLGSLLTSSLSTVDNVEFLDRTAQTPGSYALVVENNSSTATAYALAWHSLPTVKALATQPVAREIDSQAALVTVTRTGTTTLPLRVPLSYGGTAVAGVDFPALPSSIIIPAGQASATLEISVIADNRPTGNRTLEVGIGADFGLLRDPQQPALVTLEDKPFDAWRFTHFTNSELGLSSELADPDADSLPNLIEYALALDPRSPSVSALSPSRAGDYLSLTAAKNPSASDLLWSAETSGDLISWQNAVISVNTSTHFSARDSVPLGNPGQRFIRLKITRSP
jgi:hypothetical protein